MKKLTFKLSCVFLCVLLVFSSTAAFSYAIDKTKSNPFTDADRLVTQGKKIVDQSGNEVKIKGVNLGGWLIHEEWMCPVDSVDNITTFETLTKRFGQEKAYNLINEYENNWITEYDLDQIKDMGFNCVRVPFWYRNFYYDDQGTKIYDENGNWDFSRLDWIIKECKARRLYVILDFHGAPGYQSNAQHSGKDHACGLFKSTAAAEGYRKLTAELWTAIAQRYSDEPTIAMYDLLNEPMCDVVSYLEKNNAKTVSMYSRLYKAIRSVDNNHIITMEAIWRMYNLPAPYLMGWNNVVYQLHFYQRTNIGFKFLSFVSNLYPYNVPIYVGEFKSLGTATWNGMLSSFNGNGFSWSIWTYKGYGDGASSSDWFLYGSTDNSQRVDINNDSYETIMEKWGSRLRTQNSFEKTGLDETLKPYM